VGEVPARLRGRVRIDAVDLDAPPMIVQLSAPRTTAGTDAAEPPPGVPVAPAASTPAATGTAPPPTPAAAPPSPAATTVTVRNDTDPNRRDEGRLSFHDPMFFVAGAGVDANAQMQLSFRLRLHEPADKLSRRLFDNLYFSYTQLALWDLTADSKPFLDTNYIPSLFYQVPATDWVVAGHAVGLAVGYTHESNGRDGDASRSIDLLFVRPYFTFGDPTRFHWTFAPKLYVYVERSDNPDIARFRGYGDYRLTYGKDNDWQVAWTLRVGTRSGAFGSDLQATYPLHRLAPGLAGYLMGQYFTGYGESLLTYDRREPWAVRVGYAIWR
jgi:outer membrane phospholipase A